jgi:hypothetical protein
MPAECSAESFDFGTVEGRAGSGSQFHNNETARQSLYAETRLFLPIIGIFGDGARSGVTAKWTAKRYSPSAQCVQQCGSAVHFGLIHCLLAGSSSAGPSESVQYCTDAAAAAGASFDVIGARGSGGLSWTIRNATG